MIKHDDGRFFLPLQKAVIDNDINILSTLFSFSSDINSICDDCNITALHLAVVIARNDLVKYLLFCGAAADILDGCNNALHAAARVDNHVAAEFILDKYPEIVNFYNKFFYTAAELAYLYGSAKTLEVLLAKGSKIPIKKVRVQFSDPQLKFIYDSAVSRMDSILRGGQSAARFERVLSNDQRMLKIIDEVATHDPSIIKLFAKEDFFYLSIMCRAQDFTSLAEKMREAKYNISLTNMLYSFLLNELTGVNIFDDKEKSDLKTLLALAQAHCFDLRNKFVSLKNADVSIAHYMVLLGCKEQLFHALDSDILSPNCAFKNDAWDLSSSFDTVDGSLHNLFTETILRGDQNASLDILYHFQSIIHHNYTHKHS